VFPPRDLGRGASLAPLYILCRLLLKVTSADLDAAARKVKIALHFEVKGKEYFLNFVTAQGKWVLLTGTQRGFRVTPVVNDDSFPYTGDVDPSASVAGQRKIH